MCCHLDEPCASVLGSSQAVVKLLLNAGADLTATDALGRSAYTRAQTAETTGVLDTIEECAARSYPISGPNLSR